MPRDCNSTIPYPTWQRAALSSSVQQRMPWYLSSVDWCQSSKPPSIGWGVQHPLKGREKAAMMEVLGDDDPTGPVLQRSWWDENWERLPWLFKEKCPINIHSLFPTSQIRGLTAQGKRPQGEFFFTRRHSDFYWSLASGRLLCRTSSMDAASKGLDHVYLKF